MFYLLECEASDNQIRVIVRQKQLKRLPCVDIRELNLSEN